MVILAEVAVGGADEIVRFSARLGYRTANRWRGWRSNDCGTTSEGETVGNSLGDCEPEADP